MKRLAPILAILLAFCSAAPLFAQSEQDAIELTRTVIEAKMKAIVAANMELVEAESKAFWPVYNAYETEMRKVSDRRIRLISDFARAFDNLTDTQAEAFLKESFAIEKQRLDIRKKYLSKFNKVLSPKKVARFFQIENKLQAIVDYDVASEIPLVKAQ